MKLLPTIVTAAATLAGLISTVSADTSCTRTSSMGSVYWEIKIDEVDDIPSTCHLLWENLRRFSGCTVTPPNGCGDPLNHNQLFLYFTTSLACTKGSVAAAFWHATHNKWGSFGC